MSHGKQGCEAAGHTASAVSMNAGVLRLYSNIPTLGMALPTEVNLPGNTFADTSRGFFPKRL